METVEININPLTIVNYEQSPLFLMKYRIFFANGKRMDIGNSLRENYYVDTRDKHSRHCYYDGLKKSEWDQILSGSTSRFFFESILLYGKHKSMLKNINMYNRSLRIEIL